MDTLFTLTYRSRVQLKDASADLAQILRMSRLNNPRMGITGVLLYDGFHFLQTLEGPHAACLELYEPVLKDSRHGHVMPFAAGSLEMRRFPNWSMELLSRSETRRIVPDLELFDLGNAHRLAEVHAAALASLAQG